MNMKKIIVLGVIALISVGLYSFNSIDSQGEGEKYPTLQIGSEAPLQSYFMNTSSGDSYSLNTLAKSNGLLLVFSCNTCPFVVAWEDRYPELAKLTEQSEVGFALINSNEAKRDGEDSMSEMVKHAKEKGYANILYLVDKDSQLANAMGAKTTPHVFLFNNNMELVYEGAIDDNHKDAKKVKEAYLNDAIANLVNGQEINPNKTKAIGCSIKRVKQ